MKLPTRPAPSVPQIDVRRDAVTSNRVSVFERKTQTVLPKKKPPPRPPPPKLKNYLDDKLAWPSSSNSSGIIDVFPSRSLSQNPEFMSLIDLSVPSKENKFPTHISNHPGITIGNSSFFSDLKSNNLVKGMSMVNLTENSWSANKPTIIRPKPQIKKGSTAPKYYELTNLDNCVDYSLPMPSVPPPSPPRCLDESVECAMSYGVVLYNYDATHKDDLSLQVNDVVIILHEINSEWFYGRVGDNEGMFPKNFVDVRVPFKPSQENVAKALYAFNPETPEDLKLNPGTKVTVLKRISADWLYGESDGLCGQFPANFINAVPPGF